MEISEILLKISEILEFQGNLGNFVGNSQNYVGIPRFPISEISEKSKNFVGIWEIDTRPKSTIFCKKKLIILETKMRALYVNTPSFTLFIYTEKTCFVFDRNPINLGNVWALKGQTKSYEVDVEASHVLIFERMEFLAATF